MNLVTLVGVDIARIVSGKAHNSEPQFEGPAADVLRGVIAAVRLAFGFPSVEVVTSLLQGAHGSAVVIVVEVGYGFWKILVPGTMSFLEVLQRILVGVESFLRRVALDAGYTLELLRDAEGAQPF